MPFPVSFSSGLEEDLQGSYSSKFADHQLQVIHRERGRKAFEVRSVVLVDCPESITSLVVMLICLRVSFIRSMIFTFRLKMPMYSCLLYTSPSPRDGLLSRMPSSA
eukprot:TRINITY_DN2531_c0_g2_i5.p4 TRINITY_DN2531_c0_g2~~TRINITY_DN2531_c0_g2_i5.p4  ORF type:complete len:106 (+),score=3.41 TRINITY_DN2531_c0_g2_i5:2533-2850(+)